MISVFSARAARLFFHSNLKDVNELQKFQIKLQFFLFELKTFHPCYNS